MGEEKKARLAAKGWKVGNAAEFLELTSEESAYVEIRLALSDGIRALRKRRRLTQTELAQKLGSSQSRVAKLEAADPTVSLDLLIRALVVLGASPRDIARIIAPPEEPSSAAH